MIILDSKAQLTVDIISKVVENKISIINAAKLLNKSRRTIERYLQKYQKTGIQFVVHKNSGKSPANKISATVKRAKRRRSKARKRRERMESPGLLLQMDGNPHRWFGDKKSCLIAIIDDATSEIHAEFFKSETTLGYLKVLRDCIDKKGLFKALYVDRAGIFGGPKRVTSLKCNEPVMS